MSFTTLIIALKGSSLSGNWGHVGVPGHYGGSAPGGGYHGGSGADKAPAVAAKPEKKEPAEEVKKPEVKKPEPVKEEPKSDELPFHNKDYVLSRIPSEEAKVIANTFKMSEDEAKEFLGKTFSYKDEKTGFATSIDELYKSGKGEVTVSGTVFTKDGDPVGSFTRVINPDKTVYHSLFDMRESAQGSGFGSSFYKHVETSYEKAGVKAVTMTANLDVGGYAWDRMGFNFADKADQNKVIDTFRAKYQERYGKPAGLAVIPQTAYEMAAWAGPDGHRLGKDAMLGSDWSGVKVLDKKDPGYQVGQEYYKSKGKK